MHEDAGVDEEQEQLGAEEKIPLHSDNLQWTGNLWGSRVLKSRPTCGFSMQAQSAEARVVRGQPRRVFRKHYKHQSEIMYQAVSVRDQAPSYCSSRARPLAQFVLARV